MQCTMNDEEKFSVESAAQAAARDELDVWVANFLASPGSDNPVLARQLSDPPRLWVGPVRLPLDRLSRLAGPADQPVLVPVDDDFWRDDVDAMKELVEEEGWEPPPVIVTWNRGELVVEDGNHRLESLRRANVGEVWGVVSFEDAGERDRFQASATPWTP
jgi:hypothetical protein